MPNDFADASPIQTRIGIARLTHMAFAGEDLAPLTSRLLTHLNSKPTGAAALMDMSVIEQLKGNLGLGLEYQAAGLSDCQMFETTYQDDTNLSVLVFCAPLQMGGNTPIDFLLMGSKIKLSSLYCIPGRAWPDPLPNHDVAFVAMPGDSNTSRLFLRELETRIIDWPVPVINNPARIACFERDELVSTLAEIDGVLVPQTIRLNHDALSDECPLALGDLHTIGWPLIVRPIGSHAGQGLKKLDTPSELQTYVLNSPCTDFFVSSFVDYRSTDGFYRKYRIVFIDGRAFPCHMAISDKWDIWYLNAEMQQSQDKRREEAAFMDGFETSFAVRYQRALSTICDRVGLNYFGIDCAELDDGKLVVFEADNALIVHDMDPPDIYPYKPPHMQRVFSAFEAMLYAHAAVSKESALSQAI